MTGFTNLSDSSLSQDKPLTQSIARAFRDNPVAIGEGDATAPSIQHKGIVSGAFSVSTTLGSGFAISSGLVIPFNVENFDEEGWFDTTTYRYTPQKSGLYAIAVYSAQGTGGSATGATYIIRKNGATFGPVAAYNAANVATTGISTLVYLNGSTDYIDVQVSGTGLTLGGGGTSWIRGALVGYTP